MFIEKKQKRQILFSVAVSFAVDVAICIVAAVVKGEAIVGLATYAAILAIRFFLWLRSLACRFSYYYLFGKSSMSHATFLALKAANFPDPEVDSIWDYLESVARDKDQPIETRIAAASDHGALVHLSLSGRLVDFLLTTFALEHGLRQYAKLPKAN